MFEEVNRKKKVYERGILISILVVGIAFITFIPVGMATMGLPFLNMIFFMGGGISAMIFTGKI